MNELISIVIPCYNAARFIEATVHSVQQQSDDNWELIAINDGSTDNTLAILQRIARSDIRVKVLTHDNVGVSKTRNLGMSLAVGTYICFLDADDCWSTDFLLNMRTTLVTNSLDFVTTPFTYVSDKGAELQMPHKVYGLHEAMTFHLANFTPEISVCPSAYFYRLESLRKNSIHYHEKLQSPEDRHWLMQVARAGLKGGLVETPNTVVFYRVLENSLSHAIKPSLVYMQETFLKIVLEEGLLVGTEKTLFVKRMKRQLIIDFLKMKRLNKVVHYLFFK